jgi:GNAT superfamily N-acetyltransferase
VDAWVVVEVAAVDTHALRRTVLRDGDPAADVSFDGDERVGSFHLGAVVGQDLMGVASWLSSADGSLQLRGMAVDARMQGKGVGAALVAAGLARRDGRAVWANARDSALGFYERLGWVIDGDGFVTAATGIPHHRIRWPAV